MAQLVADADDVILAAHQDVAEDALGGGVKHRLQGVGIVGAGHSHSLGRAGAHPLAQGLEIFQHGPTPHRSTAS